MAEVAVPQGDLSTQDFTKIAESLKPSPTKPFSLSGATNPVNSPVQPIKEPLKQEEKKVEVNSNVKPEGTPSEKVDELQNKPQEKSKIAEPTAEEKLKEEPKKKPVEKEAKKVEVKKEEAGTAKAEDIVDDPTSVDERTKFFLETVKDEVAEIATKKEKKVVEATAEKKPKEEKTPKYQLSKEDEEDLKSYREMKKHPAFKMVDDFVRTGETDPNKFVQQFNIPDYKEMTHEQIYEMELKKQGLEPEEVAEAMLEFGELSTYKKKLQTNPIRQQLQKESDAKQKTFVPDPKQQAEIQKIRQEATEKANTKLEELADNATKSGGYYGMILEDEDIEYVKDEVRKAPIINGMSYDIEATFHREMTKPKMLKKLLANAYDLGEANGMNKVIKDRIRPDRNDFVKTEGAGGKATFSDAMKLQGVVTPSNK